MLKLDGDKLICEYADLKLRSVQRIKAEDRKRYDGLLLAALTSKVNLTSEDLIEFYELGIDAKIISNSIMAKNALYQSNAFSENRMAYNIDDIQFHNIIKSLNKELKSYTINDGEIICIGHDYGGGRKVYIYIRKKYRYEKVFVGTTQAYMYSFGPAIHASKTVSELKENVLEEIEKNGFQIKDKSNGEAISTIPYKLEWKVDNKWNMQNIVFTINTKDGIFGEKDYRDNDGYLKSILIFRNKEYRYPEDYKADTIKPYEELVDSIKNEKVKLEMQKQYEWLYKILTVAESGEYDFIADEDDSGVKIVVGTEVIYFIDNLFQSLSRDINFPMSKLSMYAIVDNTVFAFNKKLLSKYRELTKDNTGSIIFEYKY
jgi:hypothetical protein